MEQLLYPVGIVVERRLIANRWQNEQWEAVGICAGNAADEIGCRALEADALCMRWQWTGFAIELVRSEAENYFLNISAPEPKVFVMWRFENDRAEPKIATVSYGEAARMLDAGDQVDGVPMPREIYEWTAAFVAEHYKPEPRRKVGRNDPFPEAFRPGERGQRHER
jgi:hypothetical protein